MINSLFSLDGTENYYIDIMIVLRNKNYYLREVQYGDSENGLVQNVLNFRPVEFLRSTGHAVARRPFTNAAKGGLAYATLAGTAGIGPMAKVGAAVGKVTGTVGHTIAGTGAAGKVVGVYGAQKILGRFNKTLKSGINNAKTVIYRALPQSARDLNQRYNIYVDTRKIWQPGDTASVGEAAQAVGNMAKRVGGRLKSAIPKISLSPRGGTPSLVPALATN